MQVVKMTDQENYETSANQLRKECLPAAVSAGAAFNLNPLVILAQAAFESGWGNEQSGKGVPKLFPD